jgi:ATP phosphoribosyltransferase
MQIGGSWTPSGGSAFHGARKRPYVAQGRTKYPRIADSHFSSKGVQVEVVHLHGSVELAPRLGLADCILDIVQTGATLEANHLTVLEEVAPVSLRMVASRYGIQRGGHPSCRWWKIARDHKGKEPKKRMSDAERKKRRRRSLYL